MRVNIRILTEKISDLVNVGRPSLHGGELHALAGQVRAGEGVAVGERDLPPVHTEHRAYVEVSPVPVLPVRPLRIIEIDQSMIHSINVFIFMAF